MRRDDIRIRDGYGPLAAWATERIDRIDDLFHINHQRVEWEPGTPELAEHDQTLRERLAAMDQTRKAELADANGRPAQAKAVTRLGTHWEGLMVFVDHPESPMDNNAAERAIINPALGRKNFYGSGSGWSGMLALETFVQQDRFQGTCYRAANWLHVGQTQGRGRLDPKKLRALPIKEIFLYPLHKHFRTPLLASR